jgi:hypothetical protein
MFRDDLIEKYVVNVQPKHWRHGKLAYEAWDHGQEGGDRMRLSCAVMQ